MEHISRADARLQGLNHYFTGTPCKHGHIALRRTQSQECIECARLRDRLRDRKRYWHDPEKNKAKSKNWRLQNPEKVKALNDRRTPEYHKFSNKKARSKRPSYSSDRKKVDIQFKISCNLRKRISSAIKRDQKCGSAVRDLGCSIAQFKIWFERKFQAGMTWDNWGLWHIDHIRPLASFDLADRDQFLEAAHYTNLQPLWAHDNISKGAR